MPLYDFQCDCKTVELLVHPMDLERLQLICDKCGGKMVRQFSAPAIQYSYPAGHARAGRGGTGGTNEKV